MKAPKRLWLVTLFSLIGIILSVLLTEHFYKIRSGLGGLKSFCNVSEKINCDVIALSTYSELLGFPLSSWGGGVVLALFIFSLIARNPYWRKEALRVSLYTAGSGLAISLVYLGIMTFVIQTFCLLCLGLDATQLAIFITLLALKKEQDGSHEPKRTKVLLGGLVGSVLISVMGLTLFNPLHFEKAQVRSFIKKTLETDPISVNSGSEFPTLGNPNAPLTIVEFVDFQCPSCRIGASSMKGLLTRFPNQVKIVYRAFPLDPKCNSKITGHGHPLSCELAKIAYCSHQQGLFSETYESFFQNQESIKADNISNYLPKGIDPAKLQACLGQSETETAIIKDVEEGFRVNIESTPTFFVNGRRIMGGYPLPVFSELVSELLKNP